MKTIIHKDMKVYEFTNVIQVSVSVSEEIKELDMPQETIIHIIEQTDVEKTKTALLCDNTTVMTVISDYSEKLLELYRVRDGLGLTESDLYAELTKKINKLEEEMKS